MNTSSTAMIFITAFFLYFLFHPCSTADTLSPNQTFSDNQTLLSAGGTFTLGFFTPTNVSNTRYVGIWYHNLPIQTIVWVANRHHPVPQSSTGALTLSTNGTLTITATQHNSTTILWSSTPPSMNLNNPVAQLLDNGNFVVRDEHQADHVAWQSFDHPTDTLLPGMKLGWDSTTGLNRNLTSWKSPDDPSPGDYSVAMDVRGDPQLVFSYRSLRKWRSGPWTGLSFDSIPEMAAYTRNGFSFDFVNNSTGIYYSYEISNRSIITRLVVNQTGKTERYVWLGRAGWSVFWYTPRTQCSGLDSCGPNGVCGLFSSPMCRCFQGFTPRSPRDWDLLDGSDGCVRKQPLDCRNGTDRFWKMAAAQLPDTWSSFVDRSLGLEECKAKCLMNCSCTACANADVRAGGSGCILWFGDFTGLGALQSGQDLYVRLAASEFASAGKKSTDGVAIAVVVVVITVLVILLALACTAYCLCRKKKRRGNVPVTDQHNHESEMKDEDVELPIFDLSVILEGTDNFAPENKLGQGGFGPVYKGKLKGGLEIAVKSLSKDSLQGIQEFKNEVMLITKLQHRNLVRLLGCCIQAEERMLIYEYMPNKSLDAFLFDKEKSASLDWQTRYKIILGVARGLLYLHQESRVTIIHRDLKAGNILLDETMNPKISDFGMARIFGGDDSATKTRKVVGTYGYMAPEYAMDGVFSVKSDVFSYGVLVLEILSGKKNRGVYLSNPDLGLLGKAWDLWNEGKILELIDSSIASNSYSVSQVMRCIQMGLLCVQENPKDRPTMTSVFFMLGTSNVLLPQPKQPGFLAKRDSYNSTSSSNQEPSHAADTLTILEGR